MERGDGGNRNRFMHFYNIITQCFCTLVILIKAPSNETTSSQLQIMTVYPGRRMSGLTDNDRYKH